MTISSAFSDAWKTVLEAYRNGEVNSERTLQALMFAALRSRLPDTLVLCEPKIDLERHDCIIPDLVVLRGSSIVVVAELKFVPHDYPVYEFDLKKLAMLAECQQSFPVRLDPLSGKFADERFTISPECALVFAAIGKHDAAAVDAALLQAAMAEFGSRFVPLVQGIGP